MARVLLINPNSTAGMTAAMADAVRPVLDEASSLIAVTAEYGPESIEGYYDEVFAVPPMLDLVRQYEGQFDGVVIGCFDDTGVDAARCITQQPVIGICQAAMQAATLLAGSFSVVTTLSRSVPALEHLVSKYGFAHQCKRVRASDVPVLDLEDLNGTGAARIHAEVQAALDEDGAEAIVLGCAGMTALVHKLEQAFGVPVVDGVVVAAKWIESLAALNYRTSKRGGYATPRTKLYKGRFADYAP